MRHCRDSSPQPFAATAGGRMGDAMGEMVPRPAAAPFHGEPTARPATPCDRRERRSVRTGAREEQGLGGASHLLMPAPRSGHQPPVVRRRDHRGQLHRRPPVVRRRHHQRADGDAMGEEAPFEAKAVIHREVTPVSRSGTAATCRVKSVPSSRSRIPTVRAVSNA
jgi:hypothetical protein